ncbi:MAG: hypothetical protein ACE5K0_00710 [Candidatus Methanofastidiosia archaeon]
MKFQEGDFLETKEGLIFDVKGFIHPKDRVISYLRYFPSDEGGRVKDGRRYEKIYDLGKRRNFLKENYPFFLFYDEYFHRELSGVPFKRIKKTYKPRDFLKELSEKENLSDFESETLKLCELISQRSGVDFENLGISGSLLVGLESKTSDIDVLVYGRKNSLKIYKILRELRDEGTLIPYFGERLKRICKLRWEKVTPKLMKMERRKLLHGIFEDREYFLRLLSREDFRYSEVEFIPLKKCKVRAKITDDSNGIFTPCSYEVGDCSDERIKYLKSFRGRFTEQVFRGDEVFAFGMLEEVRFEKRCYHQLIMGDRGDFLERVD